MYHAVLTRTYLTTKVMPLLAALAVMLCAAMVLIVWSVMGGFLVKLLESGRATSGDVKITFPNQGFAHYDELVKMLEADTAFVAAAAPIIETAGLVSLPDDRLEIATIRGVDAASYSRVIDLPGMLHWKPLDTPVPKDTLGRDPRLDPELREKMARAFENGLTMTRPDPISGKPVPAMISGIEMTGLSFRQFGGWYEFRPQFVNAIGKTLPDGSVTWINGFMPDKFLTLRLLPIDSEGRVVEMASLTLPVANEHRTGVFELDKRMILVPLAELQAKLKMDESRGVAARDPYDPDAPATVARTIPARVTTVVVRAKPGVSPDELRSRAEAVYARWEADHRGRVPSASLMKANSLIRTWKMEQQQIVDAVENEIGMVVMLLTFISFTASFLILAIFWAMVSEKTKDVGILRAIGASRLGVAWVWVRYGLAIGILGSTLGLTLAYLIVTNINEIHDWLGANLGIVIWKPNVYYFAEIPRKINPLHAGFVFAGGIAMSLIGAVVPAWRAATMDPVRALRFE